MSIPFRLLIPRDHYHAMLTQAKAELPNECCGLLAGFVGPPEKVHGAPAEWMDLPIGMVVCRYPLVNNAASPKEYLANDRVLFNAFRDMRQRGLDLLAVYHSHPVTDPVPSKTDVERNYFDQVMHLIISQKTEQPVMRGWWLGEHKYRNGEWRIAGPDDV